LVESAANRFFERQRGFAANAAVQATSIVEAFDAIEEHQPGGLPRGRSFAREAFSAFKGAFFEALHHGVIAAVAPAAISAVDFANNIL
jgi:hypothetical protein